jgi:hypothetical protein
MSTPSAGRTVEVRGLAQTLARLPNDQAILAALLALQGELRISHWTEQASWAGLRETPNRKHSTTSLRTLVKELEASGLVVEDDGTFRCRLGRRALILRHAGTQPWFDRVCSAGATGSPEHDLIVAMAARPEEVEVWLERLIQDDPDRRTNIVAELLEPYDPAWMARLSPAAVARLDEVALLAIERNGSPMLGPYAFCAADLTRVGALTAAAASAFAGIAVLRGDRQTLRALSARASSGEAADRAAVALAMIEGRAAEAGVARPPRSRIRSAERTRASCSRSPPSPCARARPGLPAGREVGGVRRCQERPILPVVSRARGRAPRRCGAADPRAALRAQPLRGHALIVVPGAPVLRSDSCTPTSSRASSRRWLSWAHITRGWEPLGSESSSSSAPGECKRRSVRGYAQS